MDKRVALGIAAILAVAMILGAAIIGSLVLMDKDSNNGGPVKDNIDSWTEEGLDERNATSEGVSEITDALNQFGIDIYLELLNGSENVFISPYSIFTALSMTYEGASGDTETAMANVLHLPYNDMLRRGSFARVQNRINGMEDYDLSTANRIWAQEGYPFLQSFFDIIDDYYFGGIEKFYPNESPSDCEALRARINSWVENRTHDRIKDLLPQNSIVLNTRMVLTNAIYFLGDWQYQFNEDETKDSDFTLSTGETVSVPMMGMNVEDGLDYYEDDTLQALELPYKGGNLSMVILLPSGPISDLEADLSSDMLNGVISKMGKEEVNVFLPKFDMRTKYQLKTPLTDLGMGEAFFPSGKFLRMTTNPELGIDQVYHQAFVKVDEKGTEAAAATAVTMVDSAAGDEPPTFKADHPFMFFIIHKDTNSILFMGKVEDPTL